MPGSFFARHIALLAGMLLALSDSAAQAIDTHTVQSPDGTRIEYAAGGSGLPVLVFIHGWNCDRTYWRAQIDHFVASHRVVAVDLAGHGQSGTGRQDYSMPRFGQDVVASIPENAPVILVGHSMGALVMLEAARRLGDRVIGMVVVDSLKNVTPDVPDKASIDAQLAPMQADYEKTVRPSITAMFTSGADPELRDWVVTDMLAADPRIATSAVRGMLEMNFAAVFADINAPMVLINSAQTPTNMDALKAMYPDSRLTTQDGVGHFLMMERPEAFNALLARAIASFTQGD